MLAFAWPLFATYNLVVSGADEEEPGRKKPEYSAVALFLCVTSGIWAAAWAATLWLLWPQPLLLSRLTRGSADLPARAGSSESIATVRGGLGLRFAEDIFCPDEAMANKSRHRDERWRLSTSI